MSKCLLSLILLVTACSQQNNPQEQNSLSKAPEEVISYEAGVGITTTSGNFGEIQPKDTKVVTFSIKNTGDTPLQGPPSVDSANFAIIYQNNCTSVLPTKTCTVKVSFDAKGKEPGTYESNLNLDSFFLELTASIPAPEVPAEGAALAQFQPTSSGAPITEIDFGTLTGSQNVIKTFYIKNISAGTLNQAVVVPSNFINSYDMCSNRAIAKNGTCMMKLTLSAAGKSGVQDAVVTYGGASFNLKGTVQGTELPPQVTPAPKVDYLLSNVVITTAEFGEIQQSGNKMLTLLVKNTGNVSLNEAVNLTGDYLISYDMCSNKVIAVNGTCQLKVSLSGSGKSGAIAGNISFGSTNLSLTGFVATPATPTPTLFPEIAFYNGTSSTSSTTHDMGLLPYGTSQQIVLNIKNTGTLADVAKTASLNNSNFSIVSNQCQNKALGVSESCQVRVLFATSGKADGVYTSILSFGDKSFNLSAQAGSAVITYEPTYSEYGSCSALAACSGSGIQTRTITACQKLASGEPVAGGQISDCASFNVPANTQISCASPAGNIIVEVANGDKTVSCAEGSTTQNFVSLSCDENYFISGESCLADVITYEPAYSAYGTCSADEPCDGAGIQSRVISACQKLKNGSPVGGGAVEDCASFNLPENIEQSCLSPAGQKVLEVSNGDKTVSCLEGSDIQQFVSLSCDNPYTPNNTTQVCEMPTNPVATGLIIGGFSSQTYTSSLSPVISIAGAQNVDSAIFYPGSSCTGTAFTSSKIFGQLYQVTLTPGEGNRTVSARVYSPLMAQGNCVSSSVIVDTIAPTLTASLAATTTSLASQAPNATFSYSDSGSGIQTVRYYVSKAPYSAEDSSWSYSPMVQGVRDLNIGDTQYQGTYDPTYDETYGSVGALNNLLPYNTPLYVIIEVFDLAGNASYQSKPFTSTENLEFSFKYAEYLPASNTNQVVTYYLNKAFLSQYYFLSSYGIEENGDSFGQTKKFEADVYYSYYPPTDESSCIADGGTWKVPNLEEEPEFPGMEEGKCDYDKEVCLSKGLIYASTGDGNPPPFGGLMNPIHCGNSQIKIGFNYADVQNVTGNAAYNSVLSSFVFFRDNCEVTDGVLSCNFPPAAPPVPTTAKIYYTSPSGVFTRRINLNDGSTIAGSQMTITTAHREDVNPTSPTKQDMVYFNGGVFFSALNNGSQLDRVLFRVDTTTNAITKVSDNFAPTNTNLGYYGGLVVCNNELYYASNSDVYGRELWKYNNGNNVPINAVSGTGGLSPEKPVCVGNYIYFLGSASGGKYLYRYDTTTGSIPSQVMKISDGSPFDDLVYVAGQNKIYTLGTTGQATGPVKSLDVNTNAQATLANTTFVNYGDYMILGLGTDGTNLFFSQSDAFVTARTRIFNYTTGTQVYYFAGTPVNYEPTPIFANNNMLFWSFKISTGSKKKLLSGADSTLVTGTHYINKMEMVHKSLLFAADAGGTTSSPMYYFNTETMTNPLNIGSGVKFTIIGE